MTQSIFINGESVPDIVTPVSVQQLLGHPALAARVTEKTVADNLTGIAIAVNEQVIPRSTWPAYTVQQGDRVEIIHALMGG